MQQARQNRRGRTGASAPTGGADTPDVPPARHPKLTAISNSPHHKFLCATQTKIDRLRKALAAVAKLVANDLAYAPIFIRLEQEIASEEAKLHNDVLTRAQALIRQNTMDLSAA